MRPDALETPEAKRAGAIILRFFRNIARRGETLRNLAKSFLRVLPSNPEFSITSASDFMEHVEKRTVAVPVSRFLGRVFSLMNRGPFKLAVKASSENILMAYGFKQYTKEFMNFHKALDAELIRMSEKVVVLLENVAKLLSDGVPWRTVFNANWTLNYDMTEYFYFYQVTPCAPGLVGAVTCVAAKGCLSRMMFAT